MAGYRKPKIITNKDDINYLLHISLREAESLSFMMENFGEINGKKKFNTFDIIDIPPNSYGAERRNTNTFRTTVGRWVFNKVFIEPDLFNIFGYINKPIDKKMLGFINTQLSYGILEDKVPLQALKNYLMRSQKFQPYSNILSSGFTDKMLTISQKLEPMKKKLLKKYEKELANDNTKLYAIDAIQKELLAYSKEYLKGDPSMDMYDSGAKGSFNNNFKNIFVMKGVTKDPDPTKGYNVVTSNLIDGVHSDDYVNMAKSLTEGPYSRGVKTQLGGYWEKLLLRAFQHLVLGDKGSDCGTTRTITITITPDIVSMIMYNYIIDGNNMVELTSENINKYIGKTVQMRFSSLCTYAEHGKICNVCAGNYFYRAGYKNIGTATPQLASRIKNIAMKAFHDSTIKLHTIDVAKAFGYNNKE